MALNRKNLTNQWLLKTELTKENVFDILSRAVRISKNDNRKKDHICKSAEVFRRYLSTKMPKSISKNKITRKMSPKICKNEILHASYELLKHSATTTEVGRSNSPYLQNKTERTMC